MSNLPEIASRDFKSDDPRATFDEPARKNSKDEIDVLERVLFDTYEKLQLANQQLQGAIPPIDLREPRAISERISAQLCMTTCSSYLSVSVLLTSRKASDPATMRENYQQVIERLRATIFSLRSPMMEYGIPMALEDYLDSFDDLKNDGKLEISVGIGALGCKV